MTELWVGGLFIVVLFWWSAMRARERAMEAVRRHCEETGVRLLDDTVALTSLRPARDREGRLTLSRIYVFEHTLDGLLRRKGMVVMRGLRVEGVLPVIDRITPP
ncbi:MAG: DUF3301 domain-containing protein [Magnetococcales bacterium]|nr:DUF3301 domain-containing protein [Magnetococcales bacterium]